MDFNTADDFIEICGSLLEYREWHKRRFNIAYRSCGDYDLCAYDQDNVRYYVKCIYNPGELKTAIESLTCTIRDTKSKGIMMVYGINAGSRYKNNILYISVSELKQHHILKKEAPQILYRHQQHAIEKVMNAFVEDDRSQLVMACGAGKTLVSSHIGKSIADSGNGFVLYVVPSLNLLRQAVQQWKRNIPKINVITVCSTDIASHDSRYVSTTNAAQLYNLYTACDLKYTTAIFCTYQSIQTVADCYKDYKIQPFDIIICDEAHKTSGIQRGNKDLLYAKIHSNNFVPGNKRLYMTATPKVYDFNLSNSELNKLYCMDDYKCFGRIAYNLTFQDAVNIGLVVPYKLVAVQRSLDRMPHELIRGDSDLCGKIIIMCDAILRERKEGNVINRLVIYCNSVSKSKIINKIFHKVIDLYTAGWGLKFYIDHIDSHMKFMQRTEIIDKFNSAADSNECRIITNVHCISEGVDIPLLDAVAFFDAKSSKIDIIQLIGRIARKAKGKNHGTVILPICSLNDGVLDSTTYRPIIDTISAISAHDDRCTANMSVYSSDDKTSYDINSIIESHYRKLNINSIVNRISKHTRDCIIRISAACKVDKQLLDEFIKSVDLYVQSSKTTIKLVAHHIVMLHLFDSLFNVSVLSMRSIEQALLKIIKICELNDDIRRIKNIHKELKVYTKTFNSAGRQSFIKDIYHRIFKEIFKDEAEKCGMVYTPIEIVDFMIKSVEHILNSEFNASLNSNEVKVVDAFCGTGSFIARLLECRIDSEYLLNPCALQDKYQYGIFANEIFLISYYIAKMNIEGAYERRTGTQKEFKNIKLTDTFHVCNMPCLKRCINVVISNPPYRKGRKSANQEEDNTQYKCIYKRVRETYVKHGTGTQHRTYDSYICAIRWASDIIGSSGIVAFITNASFVDSVSADGVRRCLAEEYTNIYIMHLRGNQRTAGIRSREEGGKIFDNMSRTPIAITFFVKSGNQGGNIYFYDIGTFLSRNQKLEKILCMDSIKCIFANREWSKIKPNRFSDWTFQRSEEFYNMLPILYDSSRANGIFYSRSLGIITARDAWVYNYSKKELLKNVDKLISNYNIECKRKLESSYGYDRNTKDASIKWDQGLLKLFNENKQLQLQPQLVTLVDYRPFAKQWLYKDHMLLSSANRMLEIFRPGSSNLGIVTSGKGCVDFSVFAVNSPVDINFFTPCQCYPMFTYDNTRKRSNISNQSLSTFKQHCQSHDITHNCIFYYVYAILHSKEYVLKFSCSLIYEYPHIPIVKSLRLFNKFKSIGKELFDLHINYMQYSPKYLPRIFVDNQECEFYNLSNLEPCYTVNRIKKHKNDIIYNNSIRLTDLPQSEYRMNGRLPLEWVISQWSSDRNTKAMKGYGIVNDANAFAGSKHIFDTLIHSIDLGMRTQALVDKLPKLEGSLIV